MYLLNEFYALLSVVIVAALLYLFFILPARLMTAVIRWLNRH